ncbi:hypothetical protein BV341_05745 [Pseudomonas syringae pv. actinidiae]|nr:hypothetical protein BV341_05745 [Pseudomonas syringae pv. actinidiae]
MQEPFLLYDAKVHSVRELFTIMYIPSGEQVVLDPNNLAQCLDKGNLARHRQAWVRQDGLVENVLDDAQGDADVDVLDVQRVRAAEPSVHHAHFVEVLPELHLRRVRA